MALYLPLEILYFIFTDVVHDLLKRGKARTAHRLLLVSTTVRAIVEPLLYRTIKGYDARVRYLFQGVIDRPQLARWIKEFHLEDEEWDWTYSDRDGWDSRSWEGPGRRLVKPQTDVESEKAWSERLKAAAEILKSKFSANGERIRSSRDYWLRRLEKSHEEAMRWTLLVQLSNITSFTFKVRRGEFGEMATLLRLPLLENLNFIVAVGSGGEWAADVSPEEVLESIISCSTQLKSLKFDNIGGSTSFPVEHDAPRLKRILEQHAQTLMHLDIVCGIDDAKDWRMEQECTDIQGCFGSMRNFTQLKELSIQLEVLLGNPADNEHRLQDVLPPQLESLILLNLPDYHGKDDSDRIWEEDDNIMPLFQELAKAAEDGQSFASLQSVSMYISRKDRFNPPDPGQYEDEGGILGQSRIYFGWF